MSCTRLIGIAAALAASGSMIAVLRADGVAATGPIGILAMEEVPSRATGPVVSRVALDPLGRYLATTGDDHVVRLWDPRSGQILRRLEGHTDWLRACAFDPQGQWLATAGQDRQVIVWDVPAGRIARRVGRLPAAIFDLAFSPDGKTLAAGGFDSALRLFGKPEVRGERRLGVALALGQDLDEAVAKAVAAGQALVLDVVMQQGEIVQQLQSRRRGQRPSRKPVRGPDARRADRTSDQRRNRVPRQFVA